MEPLPTVEVNHQDLCRLVGKTLSVQEVKEILFGLKCEVQTEIGNQLALDVLADRPDLLSVEGVARELKGILELQKGLAKYPLASGTGSVKVDPVASGVRPYIACGVLRNVSLDDESLRQSMQLQEKLHVTYCRKRRAASIGIYDLDTVSAKIRYTAMRPGEIKFRPLEKAEQLTGSEILRETEQGREYGGILDKYERYPLLLDVNGVVLSMPPIVNSEETKVTTHTRNLLVDVTGQSERLVNQVLAILVSNLAERGGMLESVKISYPDRQTATPDMENRRLRLRIAYANSLLGIKLTGSQIAGHLKRMRFDAKASGTGALEVKAPAYRVDILGETDLVEDLAIAYGYNNFKPTLPASYTIGNELSRTKTARLVREALVGLGFQEILTFIMTNPRVQYQLMGAEASPHVEVLNPMSQEYSTLRTSLLPNVLKFLAENKHVSLPHKVFECSDVVLVDDARETRVRSERRVAAAIADDEVGYEDIQAVLQAFLKQFGVEFKLEKSSNPSLLVGRTARVVVNDAPIGLIGELDPQVLTNFGLETPVATFELNVDEFAEKICD